MKRFFRWIFHDKLGWHDGRGARLDFDGCSFSSRCSVCGRRVLRDSQGNWFAVGE